MTKHILNSEKPNYIDNKEFLAAIVKHGIAIRRAKKLKTEAPQISDYLGECFIKIANHLAFKANFINYTYRDEMISDAIENCLIYVDNFDPKKSSNPFAYFTQIAYYAFIRRIQKEKRHLQTKYRYIESLDLDNLILQSHDSGEYGNEFINYLKKEVQLSQQELAKDREAAKQKNSIKKRRPKYMDK